MWGSVSGIQTLPSNPPLLSLSKEGENLYLYLAVSATAVSTILIREEDKKQLLVYYVSQA